MKKIIETELKESISVKKEVLEKLTPQIETAATLLINTLKSGNKILFFGNGGSAADAQHLAAELIGRYRNNRPALPAIALTTDSSILTCLANDFGFETIFARQIEGLAKKGDLAVGLSTSGNSPNVLIGLKKAQELGCSTLALLGCSGGTIAPEVDLALTIPSKITARIQECHITIGHILCRLIEESLFPNG